MKFFLASVLIVALVLIGYYCYKTWKEKHRLARIVGQILPVGWLIVFVNLISLLTTSEVICSITYSIYFVATDWIAYLLLKFSIDYAGSKFEQYVKKRLMLALLILDSVSVLLNTVFGHLFRLHPVILFGNESYYELVPSPFFYIHYIIIMMLVAFCLITLFYCSAKAPVFYRKKYFLIGLMTSAIVILNIFTFSSAVDVSVIGYAVEGICIYYCALVYTPQKLLQKTMFQVTQNMSVSLFVLDSEGKRIYSNKCAEQLLDREKPVTDIDGVPIEQWCSNRYLNYNEQFIEEQTFYRGEEEMILKIQLQRVTDAKQHLQGGYFVIQDRTEEMNHLKEEQYLATHDSLTGLYNKEKFCKESKKYIRKYPELEFLVICVDIKDFKMMKDALGTKIADIVLKNTARMLKEDLKGGVVHGRIGNDVFAVLMPKKNFKEEFFEEQTSEDYLKGAGEEFAFPVVSHVGIFEVTERDLSVSVMCDRARMAISTIKGDYHKRIAYYDEEHRKDMIREQELVRDLNKALEEGQIKMYLQPQMSVEGKLLGAEALVRWEHPEKGSIQPGEFIPLFERNGLVSDIDRYIWELACKQLKAWKELGRDDIYISVNVSPRDFYFLNVYRIFMDLVRKYGVSPKNLKLEITETAIVMDFDRQIDLITRLRRTGFIVEMDDFGSGYSSLNMLKDIHVDILKIDMAFLKKAKDEERSKKILQMVIGLAKQLGMPVITEGVENEEQVAFLTEMGCEMFQGYYFAKPMTVEEFEATYF